VGTTALLVIFVTHRETAICQVTEVSRPLLNTRDQPHWDVQTSCGTTSINPADLSVTDQQGLRLATSLDTAPGRNTYRLEFEGFGILRELVGATPVR
jgi:hypothetical protein